MFKQIQTILQIACQLEPNRPVLVGVSGGPDSLCLMSLLHRSGYPLVIAHLNHGLRTEAGAEARQVERFAQSSGHPFVLGEEDVQSYADSHSLSLEEAARTVRYRFLFDQAEHYQAQAVAVGHTASDQVETVLMHLLRGTGLSGLKGMAYRSLPTAWSSGIPLVRPLLGFWREDVLVYIQENGLLPAYDATNLDTTFFRNRLRHELLPYLEQFNPHIRQSLRRTAQVLAAEDAFIEESVEAAWEKALLEEGQSPGTFAERRSGTFAERRIVALSRAILLQQPLAIQRRLLRRAISGLRPGLRDVDFQTVERGLAALSAGPEGGQRDLVAGLGLRVEGDRVWIYVAADHLPNQGWPQIKPGVSFNLEIPGSIQLPGEWEIAAEFVEDTAAAQAQARENTDPTQAWVGYENLHLPLHVRSRRAGDRFKPLGLDGHSLKLSDFMINVKIPQRARRGWPLVSSGDEILWVPGYRQAHPFRLTPDTQRVVHLMLVRGMVNRD